MPSLLDRLGHFLAELKRRKVYRVAATYAVVAFVGFQAAKLLIPSTVLPTWTDEFFLFLLIIGFPVALVVAWAFELTPEGVRRIADAEGASESMSPEERRAQSRLAMKALVGLGLVGAAVAGGWYLVDGGEESPGVDDRSVAVLPFEVSGSGADTWREGMVSLLSTGLDGAAGLRAVADRTVFATWEAHGPGEKRATTAEALSVARRIGAKYAVIGSAAALGSELQLSAGIRATTSGDELGQVQVRGVPDSVTALVHELTRQLVGVLAQETDEDLRSADLASVTTSSMPALRAYLDGERHSRAGEFRAAVEAYREAVALDSAFALAYWQLANVSGWVDAGSGAPFLRPAYRLADRLPRREGRLVRAAYLWRYGARHLAAADSLRRLAEDYPDDPRVWYELGRLIFHAGLPDGWPEADGSLREAVELDPGNAHYQVHYLHLAIALHHDSLLATRRWAEHPNPESVESWFPMALGLAFGTPEQRQRLLARLDTADGSGEVRWSGLVYALSHPRDAGLQGEVLHRAPEDMERSRRLVHNLLRRGQVESALAAVPTAPAGAVVACGLADALSLSYPLPDSVLRAYLDLSNRADDASFERLLCAGIYLAERERDQELDRLVARLHEAAGDMADEASRRPVRARNAAAIVGGYRAWKAGELERAARLLSHVVYRPDILTFSWHGIWRGDIHRELGDLETAEGWYLTTWWHPLAHQRLGRLYEQMNRPGEAAAAYRRFIAAWEDADPELQDRVGEARARLQELNGSGPESDD